MSIQGKGNLSYKKQNVQKQNAPHTGVKNITFAHLFSNAGETTIPFDALVTPPEWPTSGLVNPTSQSLLSAQLQVFKNNVTVTSSARGLIQKSEYVVHANRIEFKNITSLVNEVFEVEVADILITGNLIVDMQTIRVEGELQNDDTDFNMGYEFDILSEEIIVFREGIQMFRSDNNDSSGATGNYYYIDNEGSGKSSLIRFFEPSVGVEPILIASTGGVVDSPNVSTFQQIESLQGQLDAVIPTVAALAGVPESNFRSSPNRVDLKTFGDTLIQAAKKTKYQTKTLSPSIIGSNNSNIASLRFNNLTIGKTYKVSGQVTFQSDAGDNVRLEGIHDGLVLFQAECEDNGSGQDDESSFAFTSAPFVATATTVIFSLAGVTSALSGIQGGGNFIDTFATLEELPNHEVTTEWT